MSFTAQEIHLCKQTFLHTFQVANYSRGFFRFHSQRSNEWGVRKKDMEFVHSQKLNVNTGFHCELQISDQTKCVGP